MIFSAQALSIENIVCEFPGVRALDGVSLAFQPGRVHAITGENGAGKSTMLKILGGTITPTAGSVRFGYRNNQGHPRRLEAGRPYHPPGTFACSRSLDRRKCSPRPTSAKSFRNYRLGERVRGQPASFTTSGPDSPGTSPDRAGFESRRKAVDTDCPRPDPMAAASFCSMSRTSSLNTAEADRLSQSFETASEVVIVFTFPIVCGKSFRFATKSTCLGTVG